MEDLQTEEEQKTQAEEFLDSKANTKEFAFVHTIERMLSVFWQNLFETGLEIKGLSKDGFEDCY